MKFEFFLSLNFKTQNCLDDFKKLQNWVLYTLPYHYANFYNCLSIFAISIE